MEYLGLRLLKWLLRRWEKASTTDKLFWILVAVLVLVNLRVWGIL